ncbi:hypothetical protein ACQPYE_23765 [Actinosynnema sp. CA-299493]
MSTAENVPEPVGRPAETDPRFALMDHSMGYLFSAALRAVAALGRGRSRHVTTASPRDDLAM